jgi:hypothetical protein
MGLGTRLRNIRMRFQQSGIFARGGGALRTAAGFAGAFGIQQMFQGAREENAALTDIAITGNLTDKQLQKLRKTMFEVSNATSKSTSEMISFVSTVTTMTGDAKGAQEALAGIGEVMVATGASGEALAGTYVKLTTTMGLLPKQAREAFNVLRAQEKLGSVTLANVSANIGKIIGAAGVFGAEGKGIKGVRTLGGLFQIAQRGFAVGQEGEAATSAQAFLGFLGRRAKKVKKEFGVDVFDPKTGQARDLPTVFEELGKAFLAQPEKFRTKGQLIFGRSGIRTAQQLAEAARAPGGFAGKMGSFASANALLRGAGGEDIIASDAARRRRSASYQFDEQLNVLKNSFKKHLIPVFKQLAATMKKVGPDLVRVVKFLLENSTSLLKLWLGVKGVTFFRNLMAPVQGSAAGVAGMASGAGQGGGGAFMMPDGRMFPAARGTSGRSYPHGVGWGGQWVQGFGTQHVWQSDLQRLRAERRWHNRAGRGLGRAGRFIGAGFARYGGRGAALAGQAAGAAGMFGIGPRNYGPAWADQASNMALMSGNPWAMGAGGTYKAGNFITQLTTRQGKYGSRQGLENPWAEGMVNATAGVLVQYLRDEAKKVDLGAALQDSLSKEKDISIVRATDALGKFYSETSVGYRQKEAADRIIKQNEGLLGGGVISSILGVGTRSQAEVDLAGKGVRGVETLRGKIVAQRSYARSAAIGALRKSGFTGEITESKLEEGSPTFAKLNALFKSIDKLLVDMMSGKKIQVNAIIPAGTTPGARVENNAKPPKPEAKD